jgi:hypothetical protein
MSNIIHETAALSVEANSGLLARSMEEIQLSGLREVMELAAQPGVLSMAVGLPAADLFLRGALADAATGLLATAPDLSSTLPLFNRSSRRSWN